MTLSKGLIKADIIVTEVCVRDDVDPGYFGFFLIV